MRRARPDEAEAVGAVVVAGYDAEGYLVRPDGTFDDAYAGWLRDAGPRITQDTVVVALIDDSIVGAVTWCPFGSPSSEVATSADEGELRTLAVSPVARGRGVARALVQWCLGEARRAGLRTVWLCSLPEMLPAHALYRSFGFERTPERDRTLPDGVVLIAFRLALDPDDDPVRVPSFGA